MVHPEKRLEYSAEYAGMKFIKLLWENTVSGTACSAPVWGTGNRALHTLYSAPQASGFLNVLRSDVASTPLLIRPKRADKCAELNIRIASRDAALKLDHETGAGLEMKNQQRYEPQHWALRVWRQQHIVLMFCLHTLMNSDVKWHNEDEVIVQTDSKWGLFKTGITLRMVAPLQCARSVWNYSTYITVRLQVWC